VKESTKTIELKFDRTIPASPSEVYDAWLNPKIPGNPWNIADNCAGCRQFRFLDFKMRY
jgi:uncharacterized protein YndB with AHSA1/START domain